MNNIKRLIIVIAVVFTLFNFLTVQSKAAEWSGEEVVELIKTKINKERFEDSERNRKTESDIRDDLIKKRMIFLYIFVGIIFIISVALLIYFVKGGIMPNPMIPTMLFLTVLPFYMLLFNGYPSKEDIEKAKAELKIEDVDSKEYIKKTTQEVVDEIYSSGDTISSYSQEEAISKITRKMGISEGKVLN